jgi:glycosyltransferase involved in cell wall biosynthesis
MSRKIGVVLDAIPGAGVFQYSQAIVDALLSFPPDEFDLVAAYRDPRWLDYLPAERLKLVKIDDSLVDRGINRAWHASRLPNSLWRKVAYPLNSTVRALVREDCALWICPAHERWAFRAPINAIGTVHDLMHRYEPQFPEVSANGQTEQREFHFRETCKWSRGVLVDSEIGRTQLCDAYGIDERRVFVLPYIPPGYVYRSYENETAQTIPDLPEKFIFYPAQFWMHKNHLTLFAALDIVRRSVPDVHLVLVGAPHNGYAQARNRVTELGLEGNVSFLGYVRDAEMVELYRRARALVMPSFFGPTNIPQLEAFVLGCPVAVAGVYGVPDQVGDAALLFDPRSATGIAEAIERLWNDDELCARLVERGRIRAAEWGPPQFQERFREIVRAVLATTALPMHQ